MELLELEQLEQGVVQQELGMTVVQEFQNYYQKVQQQEDLILLI
jgi:hypothetical protein